FFRTIRVPSVDTGEVGKEMEGSATDTSLSSCVWCGSDISDVLNGLRLSAVYTKDTGDKGKILAQTQRCCKDHSEKEILLAPLVTSIKTCLKPHLGDPPIGQRPDLYDPIHTFCYSSKVLNEEADFSRKTRKRRMLTRWIHCILKHSDKDVLPSHLGGEIKHRLEKCAMRYTNQVDENDLLDDFILCMRDHRPICTCRKAVDVKEYETYLMSAWPDRSTRVEKKKLFGSSISIKRNEEELMRYSLRHGNALEDIGDRMAVGRSGGMNEDDIRCGMESSGRWTQLRSNSSDAPMEESA
ncbi:hypothetical protein PFISCL1PPCAC_15647, partial [Pristionchus fissidentatus]